MGFPVFSSFQSSQDEPCFSFELISESCRVIEARWLVLEEVFKSFPVVAAEATAALSVAHWKTYFVCPVLLRSKGQFRVFVHIGVRHRELLLLIAQRGLLLCTGRLKLLLHRWRLLLLLLIVRTSVDHLSLSLYFRRLLLRSLSLLLFLSAELLLPFIKRFLLPS